MMGEVMKYVTVDRTTYYAYTPEEFAHEANTIFWAGLSTGVAIVLLAAFAAFVGTAIYVERRHKLGYSRKWVRNIDSNIEN